MIPPSTADFATECERDSRLLAHQMYDRLRRMSDERKLNLSAEDVLISAYLGCNLVYRRNDTTEEQPNDGNDDGDNQRPANQVVTTA